MEITIEYDGKYPNLCSGHLIVTVSGSEIERANRRWDFGQYCMDSGGAAGVDFSDGGSDEYCYQSSWSIKKWPEDFPVELKDAVVKTVNSEVEHGCCGGCI